MLEVGRADRIIPSGSSKGMIELGSLFPVESRNATNRLLFSTLELELDMPDIMLNCSEFVDKPEVSLTDDPTDSASPAFAMRSSLAMRSLIRRCCSRFNTKLGLRMPLVFVGDESVSDGGDFLNSVSMADCSMGSSSSLSEFRNRLFPAKRPTFRVAKGPVVGRG